MSGKRVLAGLALAAVILALASRLLRPQAPPRPAMKPTEAQPTALASHANAQSEESVATAASSSPGDKIAFEKDTQAQAEASGSAGTLDLLGTLQAGEQVMLSTRMPARIVSVPAREGDRVRRGQLLVQLDAQEFATQARTALAGVAAAQAQVRKAQLGRSAQQVKSDSDVAAAQAGLEQAQTKQRQAILARDAARDEERAQRVTVQAGVRKAQVGLANAEQTLRGLEALAKVGGVSQADLEGARAQVTTAQADLATAQAQARQLEAGPNDSSGPSYRVALAQQDVAAAQAGVRQAQAGLRTAEEARRQTLALSAQDIRAAQAALAQARAGAAGAQEAVRTARLTSPIDGVVSSVGARAGETAQPGVPLVTVISLTGLHAEALVPARQLSRLHVGQAAQIAMDTQPGKWFPATIGEIAPAAEPDGRTFRVKFRLQNPNRALRPGQTVHIRIPGV